MDIGPARRILLVEDDTLVGLTLAYIVDELGYEPVGPAASVDEALELIEDELPDAALLDVDLGEETVFPIAEALAARDVPFAFATAFATEAKLRFPDRAILVKPYGPEEVEAALAKLVAAPWPRHRLG